MWSRLKAGDHKLYCIALDVMRKALSWKRPPTEEEVEIEEIDEDDEENAKKEYASLQVTMASAGLVELVVKIIAFDTEESGAEYDKLVIAAMKLGMELLNNGNRVPNHSRYPCEQENAGFFQSMNARVLPREGGGKA